MPKGMTKKPCPACKEEGWRDKDGICPACLRLIAEAKERREFLQNQGETKVYFCPWVYYALPYIPRLGGYEDKKFKQLFMKICEFFPPAPNPRNGRRDGLIDKAETSGLYSRIIEISEDQRNVLNDIYKEILTLVEKAYLNGRREHHLFFYKYATGEITIQSFEEIVKKYNLDGGQNESGKTNDR